MDVAVIVLGIDESQVRKSPWVACRDQLGRRGIEIHLIEEEGIGGAFNQYFDAMMLFVWQDWYNRTRFVPDRIMPVLRRHSTYRARFPETVQIALNHSDNSLNPFCLERWRPGDPVLYRTPPYDRTLLSPIPPGDIWPYERIWGSPRFDTSGDPWFEAGFIGRPTGPEGHRSEVARQTRRVGIGLCAGGDRLGWHRIVPQKLHDHLIARCRIVVCPQGWGPQSSRHWDAWLSGKPVLTDHVCASVELIPGLELEEGTHYLVFEDPEEIPDIVRHWTEPRHRAKLEGIGREGQDAANSYSPCEQLTEFFERLVRPRIGDT